MNPQDLMAKALCGGFALLCYASFTWSIFRFFDRGRGMKTSMKVVSLTGVASMAAHLAAIFWFMSFDAGRLLLSMTLFSLSLFVFWWSLRTTWRTKLSIAFSANNPVVLVRSGPYRFVRHPIYLSYMLAWTGGAVAVPGWLVWVVPVVMGLQYLAAIRQEESLFLAGSMSSEYRNYMSSAGMLFPDPIKMTRSFRTSGKDV